MIDWKFWKELLLGGPKYPQAPNLRLSREDTLYDEGLLRGTLVAGKSGAGKTSWCAMLIVDYALRHPDHGILILDQSGSLTDEFITLYHLLPKEQFEMIDRRFILDAPGHAQWVTPQPTFSPYYRFLTLEEQVQRATSVVKSLSKELRELNPTMSLSIDETLPEILRVIAQIPGWQITEVKKLLLDTRQLALAVKHYGEGVPGAKWYVEREFLSPEKKRGEDELRTYPLRSKLGVIETDPMRARFGYPLPGYTDEEIGEGGKIVAVVGDYIANQADAQAFVYTDRFLWLMSYINKRAPHHPQDKPVLLVIDEVYKLLKVPVIAEMIGAIAPMYRSRKLEPILVIQALWQLSEELRRQIWNLGNIVCFGLEDFDDAYEFSQQLFKYDPVKIKMVTDSGQTISEVDRGQYLTLANWIQHGLGFRQCIIRRYLNDRDKAPHVGFVERTREKSKGNLAEPLARIKERLIRRRAVSVREAVEAVAKRNLTIHPGPPST